MANRVNPIIRLAIGAGAAALAFAAAVPAAADVKAGVDAWSAGDYDTAIAQWRGPAENGDADALFNLAQAYRLGRGVETDVDRALELYQAAADRGHVKAADNYGLLMFQQGEQQAAMPLIRAAAERGDPRAQYVLGLAHFNADYAPKDWVRAYALLTLASAAGLPQASTALSQMDSYVPLEQRQQAQSLARQIEQEADQRRAAELAAVDLGTQQPAVTQVERSDPAPEPTPRRTSVRSARVAAAPAGDPPPVSQPTRPVPVPAAQQPVASQSQGSWRVQLGAFGVASNADRLWARLATNPALAGTQKALVPGGRVTRLQAVGFASRAQAQQACDTLKQQGQGCIVAGG